MSTTVQFRRGTALQNQQFRGAAGEISIDMDTYQLRVHDGVTYGGHVVSGGQTAGGSVTSINASGGSTGLVFTGGPIASNGTLTLSGTLAVASGGTGTINPVQTASAPLAITGSFPNTNVSLTGTVSVANGGTGVATVPGQNQVLLGDGTQYNLTTIRAGTGVNFDQTNPGVLTINSSGGGGSGTNVTLADLPPGTVQWFAMQAAPAGWLECDGRLLSKVVSSGVYAALWQAIGYTYGGSGDNFNLPDLRGQFLRGWDHGAGVDAGRAFGSTQTDAFQGHYHTMSYPYTGASGTDTNAVLNTSAGTSIANRVTAATTDGTNGTPRTAAETRPKNVAMLACIKFTSGAAATMVTSVNVTSGFSALSFSGGPITSTGTIQLNTNGGSPTTFLRGDGTWAVPAVTGLGYGQTYQDVTSSRANNTNYTNNTGKPIWVSVLSSGSASNAQTNRLYCDNIIIADMNNDSNFQALLTGIIPPGSVYKVILGASYGVSRWIELR